MRNIQDYVDDLFKKIPHSKQKDNMVNDIKQDLAEKVSDLMEQGKSEEDAISKAIVEFGDIEDIRQELGAKPLETGDRARFQLVFALGGSLLIIALAAFINFYYTPHSIWFVYPTFVVLWWPLAMFYRWQVFKKK